MMWPFKKANRQRVFSAIMMFFGIFLMINHGIINIFGVSIDKFVLGMFVAFAGFLYFVDLD